MRRASPKPSSRAGWIIGILVAAALAAVGTGVALLVFQSDPARHPNEPTPSIPVHAEKSPDQFGLPVYAGAFGFHSMEAGADRGSSAFSVKEGTSVEVARFYRQALETTGWKFSWQAHAQEQPGSPAGARLPAAKGLRVRWQNSALHRQLTLLTLDFPQPGSSGQVLLTWSPTPPGEKPAARN